MLAERTQVGVFVDALDLDYQQQVLLGIDEEARALDLDLLCFAGGRLEPDPPRPGNPNFIYDLCGEEQLGALVALSGTLSGAAGMQVVSNYCRRFMHLPVCSVGGQLPGAVEVFVDNRAGVRHALTHLAQNCGRRRIAFVRGPEGNEEAHARFEVYSEAVRDLRLASEPELVVEGDFLEASGARAVSTLLDDRRLGFDALMCASDLMAMGALRQLAERRVPVPRKVAVVGFDDIQAARFMSPSLATVRQPLFQQGRRALREVVARLSEANLPERVFLNATFVPRESCGARDLSSFAEGLTSQLSQPARAEVTRFEDAYRSALPRILSDVQRVIEEAGFACDAQVPESLLMQASADVRGRRRGLLQGPGFVSFLKDAITATDSAAAANVSAWQEVVGVIRRHFALCLRNDPLWARGAEEMWDAARVVISHLAERSQARRWLAETELSRSLLGAGRALLNARGAEEVARTLAAQLPSLRVPGCFVARLDARGGYGCAAAVRDGRVIEGIGGEFGTARLLPTELRSRERRATWLLEPLVLQGRQVGYAAFEMGPPPGRIYAALRDYLAASLGREST